MQGSADIPLPAEDDLMDVFRHFSLFDAFILATLAFVLVAGYLGERSGGDKA
jgi:hypothetical protein